MFVDLKGPQTVKIIWGEGIKRNKESSPTSKAYDTTSNFGVITSVLYCYKDRQID